MSATDEEIHAVNAIALARKGRLLEKVAGTPLADEYREHIAAIKLLDSLEPPVDAATVLQDGFEVTPDTVKYHELLREPANLGTHTWPTHERAITAEQYEAYLEVCKTGVNP